MKRNKKERERVGKKERKKEKEGKKERKKEILAGQRTMVMASSDTKVQRLN